MFKKDPFPVDSPMEETPASDLIVLSRLIERSLAGDAGAMQALYDRYKRSFFGLACRYASDYAAAEDLLQDIFLKIFTHLSEAKNIATFSAWAYRIALNTCYSHLRSRRGAAGQTVSLSDIEGCLADPAAECSAGDIRKPLEDALRTLPEKLRSVFLLHDVQGFKHEEISIMMGWSIGTSKSQLFKARRKLRDVLRAKRAV